MYGVSNLFFVDEPNAKQTGLHFLILALYFYISFYEFRRDPFPRPLYYLVASLLLADGITHLFLLEQINFLSGIVSLFFAISAWMSAQRVSAK